MMTMPDRDVLHEVEPPFDAGRLDRLMEEAGLDLLLACSRHNVRWLLGGYAFLFFSAMEAIGHSRYLPIVIYAKGRPADAGYVAYGMEKYDHATRPFWTPGFLPVARGTQDAAAAAAGHVERIGGARARIGIEPGFLPADAWRVLTERLPDARFGDATGVLERARALKTPEELGKLRLASELITDSMLATITGLGAGVGEGATKNAIIERLRREETDRGLGFDYCLITAGTSLNRGPSDQVWERGDILSLDSGGNWQGWIGDLCRMGIRGEPDAELEDLLAEVDAAQQAAFGAVRAGAPGGEVIARGEAARRAGPNAGCTDFVAHGMGLVSHEVPFLMKHPVGYEGVDAERPLEAGMVLSVETTMEHPRRGFIKLEDTVAVTADGYEIFGDRGRGWNRAG
jgi:Xaa-Pro aminopeptidase